MKWYIVHIRLRYERKVCDILNKKNIENFCPVNNSIKETGNSRARAFNEPLFTGYVFVKTTEAQLYSLKQVDGILNLVYWLGAPAVINEEEIMMLKTISGEYNNISIEKTKIALDDKMIVYKSEILHGDDYPGSTKKILRAIFPSIGYSVFAESILPQVKIINISKTEALKSQSAAI